MRIVCLSDCLDISIHIHFLIFSMITLFFLLPVNFIFQDVADKSTCATPLRTLAPWPRTSLPQVMNPTSTTSRRLVSNTPRSPRASSGLPMTFDYDDVTIGKTLLDACRRRADHSEEESLSSGLSSSVSHDRTGRPVVCSTFDSQVSSVQETQRREQIRILLERQREQILADCQAEIRKHEFQTEEVFKS